MSFTIITVTYNSAHIIKDFLQQFNDCKDYSIIVVDNNSSDETIKLIEGLNYANISIIKSEQNIGFSRANNLALRKVKDEYAILLNPDCKIEIDAIKTTLLKAKNHKNIAICAPELYGVKDKDVTAVRKNQSLELVNDGIFDAKFISGCCMFLRMEIFQKIGFFDEGFFLYCEDNEICKRVINKGYHLGIVKGCKVIHMSNQSSTQEVKSKIKFAILIHKLGWSKCYYTELVHFKLVGKLKAVRDIIRCLLKLALKRNAAEHVKMQNKAKLYGSFFYLIGKKAFNKDGSPLAFKKSYKNK